MSLAEGNPEREDASRALAAGLCLHCQGELGRFHRTEDGPFCCQGCRGVYELIHGAGLTRYYDLRRGRQSPAPSLRPDSLAWFESLTATGEDKILRLSLDIQGVHCAACIWLLEELFRREAGGIELRINSALGKVDLAWDPSRGDLRHYLREAERFGYRFGPGRKTRERSSRGLLVRMAVTTAIALNVMLFTLSYYFGLAPADGALYAAFGWLNLGLATISILVGGPVFFRAALAGLRRRVAHLDLPISLGMLLAYAGSVYAFFSQGPRAAYFDTLTVFVALMLIGRWAREEVLERNRNALLDTGGVESLLSRRQGAAGQGASELSVIPAAEIKRADELWIAPGDLVPVEGILLRQRAELSLDWITGESEQHGYEPGDRVPAGAYNAGDHGFAVGAAEDFGDSRLHDLLRSGPLRGEERASRWWYHLGGAYVLSVLLLAAAAFLLWYGEGPRRALEVGIAVLVITCPCALGLASPLAEELIHLALRRRGVFLRRAGFLDRALAVRKILLDKTGTLTLGRLKLTAESREQLSGLDAEAKQVLWSMSARSNHPVSRCLADALGASAPGGKPSGKGAETLVETAGQGLDWELRGRRYRLGRAHFALPSPPTEPSSSAQASVLPPEAGPDDDHSPPTVFSADGRALALFRFEEEFKADAADEIRRLAAGGYELHLLSGDDPAKVERARQALGIAAHRASGGLNPEAKAARVRDLDDGDTLMVGDGINDAPSFEAAHCAATPAVDRPVLPGKADFYYLGDSVAALRRALGAARRLRRIQRDNLWFALAYNLLAVGLCFAGLVTPVLAAILMPASSVGVVSWTAYRLSGRRLAWMS